MEKTDTPKSSKDNIKVDKTPDGLSKRKIEIIAASVLVIIFILAAARATLTGKAKRAPVVPSAKKAFTGSKTLMDERLARIEADAERIGWERNPFVRGRISGASGIGALDLSGKQYGSQGRRCNRKV